MPPGARPGAENEVTLDLLAMFPDTVQAITIPVAAHELHHLGYDSVRRKDAATTALVDGPWNHRLVARLLDDLIGEGSATHYCDPPADILHAWLSRAFDPALAEQMRAGLGTMEERVSAGRVGHAPLGADFARELLGRAGDLPRPFIDTVEGLIRFHSLASDALSDDVLRTFGGRVPTELLLIKDADGLDELGAEFVLLDAMHLGAEPDVYPAYLTRSAKYLPRLYSQEWRFHTQAAKRHYQRLTGVVRTFVGSLKEEIAGQLWEGELIGASR